MIKVLSIAGFDPSAGAGILADIKTFESFNVYGFGVCTAVTVQNEYSFDEPGWVDDDMIVKQLECLFREHRFEVAKIGLVRSIESLEIITDQLVRYNPSVKIIWDPIIKSSSGFLFHERPEDHKIGSILSRLFLVTPNYDEALLLGIEKGGACNVLVKGGHREGDQCDDELFMNNGHHLVFNAERIPGAQKHGSGCVLSAAIAANLQLGQSLAESCQTAKEYVTEFLASTDTLLGLHRRFYEKA